MALNRSGRLVDRQGASQLGCLLRLALVVAAVWVGLQFADPYFRYAQVEDAMKQAAEFATNLSDEEIRRRVLAEVRKQQLPEAAERIGIVRRDGRDIEIWLQYTDTVKIPGFTYPWDFEARVKEPL